MVSKTLLQKIVGHGSKSDRSDDDFYATPEHAIREMINRITFEGDIWEPSCGDGAISKILKEKGYNVYSTDLVDRGYGDAHFDFMKSLEPCENIVTNPPFNISTKYTLHALRLASKKVVMFNKLSFLEGKERRDKLFSQNYLKSVYVFGERVSFTKVGAKAGGMLAFAWYEFDKSYQGKPSIEWI